MNEPRGAAIFYMPMSWDTDAKLAVDRRLAIEANQGVRLITADPTESALNPLSWYAQRSMKLRLLWCIFLQTGAR